MKPSLDSKYLDMFAKALFYSIILDLLNIGELDMSIEKMGLKTTDLVGRFFGHYTPINQGFYKHIRNLLFMFNCKPSV